LQLKPDPLAGGVRVESSDFFLTLGEIAVTLSGFASVVVIFNRRESGSWDRVDIIRLRGMLGTSLSAAFFSVLPVGLHGAGVSEAAAWSVSSLGLGCLMIFAVVVVFGRLRSLPSDSFSRPGSHLMRGSLVLVAFLLVLNAFSLGLTSGPAIYIFAVALLLVLAGVLFWRMVTLPLTE
jgi:hypothetical protein